MPHDWLEVDEQTSIVYNIGINSSYVDYCSNEQSWPNVQPEILLSQIYTMQNT
jgi:hypothetical protein